MPLNNYFSYFAFASLISFHQTQTPICETGKILFTSQYILGTAYLENLLYYFPNLELAMSSFLDNILFYVHIELIISLFSVFWFLTTESLLPLEGLHPLG